MLTAKQVGLVGNRHVLCTFGLLLRKVELIVFLIFYDITPFQLFDVTVAQSRQGREQCCSLKNITIAWCGGQLIEFLQCQIFTLTFLVVYVLNFGCKVNGQVTINEGLMKCCLEYREISRCRISGYGSLLTTSLGAFCRKAL